MKVHDCVQGSDEWAALRAGMPTASEFHRIVTPTGKLSAASHTYLCELVAEDYVGPMDTAKSGFMERGSEMEKDAVSYYEFVREVDTKVVGFVSWGMDAGGSVGCSPDRLVGDHGGLEIKCPSAGIHVQHLLDMPAKYMPQVQGCIWLTGRQWWDLLSFNPFMPPALVRVERDNDFIATLAGAVNEFVERLVEARAKVKAMVTPATEETA